MEKQCSSCEKTLPEDSFSWREKGKTRQHLCKQCHSEYRKKHYLKNKEKYLAKAKRWNAKRHEELKTFRLDYLSSHPCVDCGEADPVVLDFDHIRDKDYLVSRMYDFSFKRVIQEIEKCEVRCANCHRRRHHRLRQE